MNARHQEKRAVGREKQYIYISLVIIVYDALLEILALLIVLLLIARVQA